MGTAMAGVAGGLYTYFARFLMPDDFGFITSITVLSMVVVGGIGSVFGVIVATIILTLMPEFFRFISDYKLLVYGTLLFGVVDANALRLVLGALTLWFAVHYWFQLRATREQPPANASPAPSVL